MGIPSLILLLRIIVVLIHRLGNYSNTSTMSALLHNDNNDGIEVKALVTMIDLLAFFSVIIKLMQAGSVERSHLYFVSIQYYYCLLALLFP